MLALGQVFPSFKLKAVVSSTPENAFTEISNEDYKGNWLIVFSWPMDFSLVCPTELAAFSKNNEAFQKRNTQILGFSIDSPYAHLAWRRECKLLKDLAFPMLSDNKRELAQALGILDPAEGVAQRATFIVDPSNIIRFIMVTDLSVGRNVDEILRILEALQTGGLCPTNWKVGDDTLDILAMLKENMLESAPSAD